MRRRRWLGFIALLAVAVASLWYLQAPPRGLHDYAERAANTAEALRSQVESARLWTAAVDRDRATHAATAIGLAEADADASELSSDFAELDPPRGADRLRTALVALASDVTGELAAARIAAHRGAWEAVPRTDPALRRLAARLTRLERRARP